MKEIITNIDELRTPVEPLKCITDNGISREEGDEIIAELKAILTADENLIALAAPQIGINKRIFCIKFSDTIKTFINPIVTKKIGTVIAPETCASMPGMEILIGRPQELTVVYYTDEYKYEDNKLTGAAARLFDQQVQLLDGVVPSDLGLVSEVAKVGSLADLSEDEKKEIQEYYKEFIKHKIAAMEKEINTDENLAKEYRVLKFTESVINGRSQVIADKDTDDKAKKAKEVVDKSMLVAGMSQKALQKSNYRASVEKLTRKRK